MSQPGQYQAIATTSSGTGYSNVVTVNGPAPVTVQVTPAGPLVLPGGGSATLTATATTPGFNVGGNGFRSFNGFVDALVVQPDGKVLVGGEFTAYNGNTAAPDNVLRLNPDGTLDPSFNPGGSGATGTGVFALALQPDGKVLIGGQFTGYNGNAAAPARVLRLNPDGTLDTSFNPGGSGTDNIVLALALQADGKVLVGGQFTSYNGFVATPDYLLRLNADGSIDRSFNRGGDGPSGGIGSGVRALAAQPDGKVLVGGSFSSYNGNAAAPDNLLRLNSNGTLDAGFNPGGSGADSGVFAVVGQADGRALVGGQFSSYNGSAAPQKVLRLNPDGTLDTSFSPGGSATNGVVLALAVQADGKVLTVGNFTVYNGNAAPARALRLNTDGTLDASFNPGGAGADQFVRAVAVQVDGKVLIGGDFNSYNGTTVGRLARLNANGTLNNATAPLSGATFVFNPGNTPGNTRTVGTAGSYSATATDPATGCTYTSNTVVVSIAAPVLTNLTPPNGLAGSTQLTLTGSDLSGATAVTFTPSGGGTATTVTSGYTVASNTSLTGVRVPAGLAPGTYSVTVTTPGGTSNALAFTVDVPCTAPTNVALGPLTPTTAQVTFTGSGTASGGYTAVATPTSGGAPVSVTGAASPLTLTGLSPNTAYTVTVTSQCASSLTATSDPAVALTTPCQAPVLSSVPANQTVAADPGQCNALVSFQAQASGVPAPTLTYTLGGTPITSPYAFPLGTSAVMAKATNCGGTVTRSFTVTVQDQQAPVARTQNLTVALVNGAAAITPTQINNGSTDNCTSAAALGLRLDKTAFTCANIGPNQVTLTVTDASGNTSTAPATVTVTGTVPQPRISVSSSTTLYLGYGSRTATLTGSGGDPSATYTWSPATGLSTTTGPTTTFTATAEGSYPITLTVTSASGCSATTSVTLTVEDVQCGNKSDKVQVCHNGQLICVASSAVSAHLSHGDQLGSCTSKTAATSALAVASLSGSEPADATPLLEAYPNPFTASTSVRFRTSQDGAVRVVVYNVLGQPVATLYDENAQAGQVVERTLGGTSLTTGVYIIRLTGSGQSLVQKVVLTK